MFQSALGTKSAGQMGPLCAIYQPGRPFVDAQGPIQSRPIWVTTDIFCVELFNVLGRSKVVCMLWRYNS